MFAPPLLAAHASASVSSIRSMNSGGVDGSDGTVGFVRAEELLDPPCRFQIPLRSWHKPVDADNPFVGEALKKLVDWFASAHHLGGMIHPWLSRRRWEKQRDGGVVGIAEKIVGIDIAAMQATAGVEVDRQTLHRIPGVGVASRLLRGDHRVQSVAQLGVGAEHAGSEIMSGHPGDHLHLLGAGAVAQPFEADFAAGDLGHLEVQRAAHALVAQFLKD